MTDRHDPRVASVLAHLLGELEEMSSREPHEMALVAALIDGAEAREAVTQLLLAIMPEKVDGDQWIAWVQGSSPPLPRPLRDPDAGGRPHARGRMLAAQGKRDAAAARVARLNAQLGEAQQELTAAEAELRQTNDQVRIVVAYRLMVEIGRQASALSLGPLYAVARAISPYLQQDPAFEDSLDADRRHLLEERRQTREEDSREILDRLDRHAGDEELELKLHRAILTVIREVHEKFEAENATAKSAGKRMPERNKGRVRRRTFEAHRHDVHGAAPRADAADVFDAFRVDGHL